MQHEFGASRLIMGVHLGYLSKGIPHPSSGRLLDVTLTRDLLHAGVVSSSSPLKLLKAWQPLCLLSQPGSSQCLPYRSALNTHPCAMKAEARTASRALQLLGYSRYTQYQAGQ